MRTGGRDTDSFNRRFKNSKQITVGKTYVGQVIKNHQYDIQIIRKKLKHRKPKSLPRNLIWGMDLTGKSDTQNKIHNIFGIVDHGSRANLCLQGLKNKASITLLRHLLDAIEQYGKPKFIRMMMCRDAQMSRKVGHRERPMKAVSHLNYSVLVCGFST